VFLGGEMAGPVLNPPKLAKHTIILNAVDRDGNSVQFELPEGQQFEQGFVNLDKLVLGEIIKQGNFFRFSEILKVFGEVTELVARFKPENIRLKYEIIDPAFSQTLPVNKSTILYPADAYIEDGFSESPLPLLDPRKIGMEPNQTIGFGSGDYEYKATMGDNGEILIVRKTEGTVFESYWLKDNYPSANIKSLFNVRRIVDESGRFLEITFDPQNIPEPKLVILRKRSPSPPLQEKRSPLQTIGQVVSRDPDADLYVALTNQDQLQQGDILPNRDAELGDAETLIREELTCNFKESSAVYPVLVKAKEIGRKKGLSNLEIADEVADMVQKNFAEGQGPRLNGDAGKMTIGYFVEKGGCCRHRSAALQMALQEAGVPSRYIQGSVAGGGNHAWVAVDVKGDGSYSYVIDLNMKNRGFIEYPVKGLNLYTAGKCGYVVNPEKYNLVWRPNANLEAAPVVVAEPVQAEPVQAEPVQAEPETGVYINDEAVSQAEDGSWRIDAKDARGVSSEPDNYTPNPRYADSRIKIKIADAEYEIVSWGGKKAIFYISRNEGDVRFRLRIDPERPLEFGRLVIGINKSEIVVAPKGSPAAKALMSAPAGANVATEAVAFKFSLLTGVFGVLGAVAAGLAAYGIEKKLEEKYGELALWEKAAVNAVTGFSIMGALHAVNVKVLPRLLPQSIASMPFWRSFFYGTGLGAVASAVINPVVGKVDQMLGVDEDSAAGMALQVAIGATLVTATLAAVPAGLTGLVLVGTVIEYAAVAALGFGAAALATHEADDAIAKTDIFDGKTYTEAVAEDPWLAAPVATWVMCASPLPGLAIYGLHRLYEWISEGEGETSELEMDASTAPDAVLPDAATDADAVEADVRAADNPPVMYKFKYRPLAPGF